MSQHILLRHCHTTQRQATSGLFVCDVFGCSAANAMRTKSKLAMGRKRHQNVNPAAAIQFSVSFEQSRHRKCKHSSKVTANCRIQFSWVACSNLNERIPEFCLRFSPSRASSKRPSTMSAICFLLCTQITQSQYAVSIQETPVAIRVTGSKRRVSNKLSSIDCALTVRQAKAVRTFRAT